MQEESLYRPALPVAEVPPEGRKRIEWNGERVTIFHAGGNYHAISDLCPHKNTAPLLRGKLDGLGVKCPNHGYRFDFLTGACNVDPSLRVRVYPVKVVEDIIHLGPPVCGPE